MMRSIALLALPAVALCHPSVLPVGEPVDVWAAVDTLHKCDIIDVPDIPARVFQDDTGMTHMIVGSTNFHWMNGPSPLDVTRNCSVAWNMTGDPDPAKFAEHEFLDSPIAFENGTVVSLVHTEFYQCEEGETYPYCWTVTIGLAVSYDWGSTWQHMQEPPHHLVASLPYKYNHSQIASGWGDPSNIVRSPKDGYYYAAIWNRNQVGLQDPGVCIMRTSDLMDPSSWRAWGGHDFSVTFVSPYTMEPGTEAQHVCTVSNLPSNGCAAMGLVWSSYLEQFVTTLDCGIETDHFLFATSDDLINWSEPVSFYSKKDLPVDVASMVTGMNYPTFIDPTAPTAFSDPNFYTIGQEPYLYWASIGHSPHTDGRHQWATKVRFEKDATETLV